MFPCMTFRLKAKPSATSDGLRESFSRFPGSLYSMPILRIPSLIISIVLVLHGTSSDGQGAAFVGPEDTILFMGDSITLASTKPAGFATLVGESLKKALPGSNVNIQSVAKGGCGIRYLNTIFDTKAAPLKPDIVVILIGINDVRTSTDRLGADPIEFEQALEKLVTRCQAIGAKTVICTPIFRGEKTDGSNPYDALIEQYVAACKNAAVKSSSLLIDLRARFMQRLLAINSGNTAEGHLSKDGVHPNAEGNALIADAILEAWSIPNAR